MRRAFYLSIIVITATATAGFAQTLFPPDSVIRSILVQRIDKQHQSVGIVVGLIDLTGRRIISHGALAKNDPRPLDGNTIFEIGSVTKVFTSLVLADMVRRGEVKLDDPVAKYLPADVRVPERNGRVITLVDLATHSSGLPRIPTNLQPKSMANPYVDYTVEQLYAFLSGYTLPRDIGSEFEYSNLGVGLLGHALACRAGVDYETLVRTHVLDPLGMTSTRVTIPNDWKSRFAAGYDAELRPPASWDLPTLAGAGALRSTVNDLLTFVAANLGFTSSPLSPAMADMLRVSRPAGAPGVTIGLGWVTAAPPAQPKFISHDGGTGGFRSFVGFDPARRIGVVVLSNAATAVGVSDIGAHLLNDKVPLMPPPVKAEHKEIAINVAVLDGYLGTYQLVPGFDVTIARRGDRLTAQATGQGAFDLFPEGPNLFFAKVADIQIRFETDSSGKATVMALTQSGITNRAPRIP